MKAFTKKFKKTFHKLGSNKQENDHDRKHHHDNPEHKENKQTCSTSLPASNATESTNVTPATLSSVASNRSVISTNNKNDTKSTHSDHAMQINALHSYEEEFAQDDNETSQLHSSRQEIKPNATPLQTETITERKSEGFHNNTADSIHDVTDKVEMTRVNQNMTSTELNDKTTDNQINTKDNSVSDNEENEKEEVNTTINELRRKSQSKELFTVDTPKENSEQIDADANKDCELLTNASHNSDKSIVQQFNEKAINNSTISSLENSDDKFHIYENVINSNTKDSVDREPSIEFDIVGNDSRNEEVAKNDEVNSNNSNDDDDDQAAQSMVCNVDNNASEEISENVSESAIHNSHNKMKTNEVSVNSAKANGKLPGKENISNTIESSKGINSCGTKDTELLVKGSEEHETTKTVLPQRVNNYRTAKSSISQSDSNYSGNSSHEHRNVNSKERYKNKDIKETRISNNNVNNNNEDNTGIISQPSSFYKRHSRINRSNSKSSVVSDNDSRSVSSECSSINVFDYKSLLNQCHRKADVITKREERLAQHERSLVPPNRNHRYRKAIETWQSEDEENEHTRSLSSNEWNNINAKIKHRFADEKSAQTASHHTTHSRLPYRHSMHTLTEQENRHSLSQRPSRSSSQHIGSSRHLHELKEKILQKEQGMQSAAMDSSQKNRQKQERTHSERGRKSVNSEKRIASSTRTSPSQSISSLSNKKKYYHIDRDSKRRSQSPSELSNLSNTLSTYMSEDDFRYQTNNLKKAPSHRRRSSISPEVSDVESVRSNTFVKPNIQRQPTKNKKEEEEEYYNKKNNRNDFLESCRSDRSRRSQQMSLTPHSQGTEDENDIRHLHNEQLQEEQQQEPELSNSMRTPERLSLSSLCRLHEGNDTEPSRMSKVEENMLKEVEEQLDTLQHEMKEYDAVLEQNMLSNSFERLYHLNNRRDRAERESRLREFEKLTALKEKLLNGEVMKNLQARQERRKMWERQLRSPDNVFERLYMNSPTSSQMHRRERSRTTSQNSRTSSINRNKNGKSSPNSFSVARSSRTSSNHSRRSAEEVCSLLYSDGLELTRRRAREERQNEESRKAEELQEVLVAKLASQLRHSARSDMEFLNSQLWLSRAREELHKRMERDPEHYVENILRGKRLTKEEQQMSARRLLIHGKAMKERLEAEKCKEEMKECTFHPKINDAPYYSALLTSSSSTPGRTQSRKASRNSTNNNADNKYNANEPIRTKCDRCVYLYKSAQVTRNKRAELEAKQAMERRKSILKNRLENDHHFRRRVQLDPTLAERFMNSLVV